MGLGQVTAWIYDSNTRLGLILDNPTAYGFQDNSTVRTTLLESSTFARLQRLIFRNAVRQCHQPGLVQRLPRGEYLAAALVWQHSTTHILLPCSPLAFTITSPRISTASFPEEVSKLSDTKGRGRINIIVSLSNVRAAVFGMCGLVTRRSAEQNHVLQKHCPSTHVRIFVPSVNLGRKRTSEGSAFRFRLMKGPSRQRGYEFARLEGA